jgi:hypothetical protein
VHGAQRPDAEQRAGHDTRSFPGGSHQQHRARAEHRENAEVERRVDANESCGAERGLVAEERCGQDAGRVE